MTKKRRQTLIGAAVGVLLTVIGMTIYAAVSDDGPKMPKMRLERWNATARELVTE